MSTFVNARAQLLAGTSNITSSCSHTPPAQEFPGPNALDVLGKPIEVACGKCSALYTLPTDVASAIQDYCSHSGQTFFQGDKIKNSIRAGQAQHIYTTGTSLKSQASSFYEDPKVCR